MPVDADIIRRIGEDQVDLLILKQLLDHARIRGVAADQPVPAEAPDVAR